MLTAIFAAMPAPARAAASRSAWTVIAQADTTSNPSGPQANPGDDEEDDNGVPIPPNLLEPEPKSVPPDTTGAPAARSDSTRNVVPAIPASPETLRYTPPSETAAAAKTRPPIVTAPKRRGGILGLTPMVVILGLAVVHFLVVQAVK